MVLPGLRIPGIRRLKRKVKGFSVSDDSGLKAGEVARKTGISVRTLHHYEEVGLLASVQRTTSGHRRYRHEDIVRLQQIRSLQHLGLSLADIRDTLAGAEPLDIIQEHLEKSRIRLAELQELCARLENLCRVMAEEQQVSTGELLHTLAVMSLMERHFGPQKADALRARHQEIEASVWNSMVADLLDEIRRGTAPADPRALALTRRWRGSIKLLMGDDLLEEEDLLAMFRADPPAAHGHGLDEEAVAWLHEALDRHSPDQQKNAKEKP